MGWEYHLQVMSGNGATALRIFLHHLQHLPRLDPFTLFLVYDATVSSVYLYGCEFWAGMPCRELDNLHRRFLLRAMHASSHVSNDALLSEAGRFSVTYETRRRQLGFLCRVWNGRCGPLAQKALLEAQAAYTSTNQFRNMQADHTYVYRQHHNMYARFAALLSYVGHRTLISSGSH